MSLEWVFEARQGRLLSCPTRLSVARMLNLKHAGERGFCHQLRAKMIRWGSVQRLQYLDGARHHLTAVSTLANSCPWC